MTKYSYQTLSGTTAAKVMEKGSRFISYAVPVASEKDVTETLKNIQEEHPKASHHCYAYRLGVQGKQYRANDDGEPSGTAGRPILGQIDSYELTNCLIIVVRYYGGTNLGTSGLASAYKLAAKLALEQANIVQKELMSTLDVFIPYQTVNHFQEWINHQQFTIIDEQYSDKGGHYQLTVPKRKEKQLLRNIRHQFKGQ